jgi:sarcosine oxidase, subunit beta
VGRVDGQADFVVVGGGTVGAWCAYFLARSGAGRVVLVDKRTLGQGATSRAAGIVRGQGGTPTAVRLAQWTQEFYLRQRAELGTDSGFTVQGYFMPCFSEPEVAAAHERMAMQRELGLDVRWLEPDEAARVNPTLARGVHLGGTYAAGDGWLHPPRNVAAYTVALHSAGVEVREETAFAGLLRGDNGQVAGVATTDGVSDQVIATKNVVLTGGPELAEVGRLAGIRVPAGAARHQVAVTERHPELDASRLPMVFDLPSGLYWRPEDRGVLFGMSNPVETPGPALEIDEAYLAKMRGRLAQLVPATRGLGLRRVWAATIEYTPDHLPILGPGLDAEGTVIDGVTVACASGHGMMWGPAISRAAADLALSGGTGVTDTSMLGLDRFDADGRSSLAADPIALPFPEAVASHQVSVPEPSRSSAHSSSQ